MAAAQVVARRSQPRDALGRSPGAVLQASAHALPYSASWVTPRAVAPSLWTRAPGETPLRPTAAPGSCGPASWRYRPFAECARHASGVPYRAVGRIRIHADMRRRSVAAARLQAWYSAEKETLLTGLICRFQPVR